MSNLRTKAILERLIGFDTVSSNSNLNLLAWIEDYLRDYGVESKRIDEVEGKASLIARIGPDGPGGLVFSGHTDVVPVASQPWSRDPFTLHEENGRYYGRGTCDMKGFIACVLAQVPFWTEKALSRPIYLAFTRDEEIGCLGAEAMAAYLNARGDEKQLVIVGEPTSMQPVVAQKGITSFRTTVYGEAAHSSQVGQGVSAVHIAARLVTEIEQVMAALVEDGEVDEGFNVPFSSLHVGIIGGGTAINVKARECSFEWEIRHLPTQTMEAIMARVDAVIARLQVEYPQLRVQTDMIGHTVPGLANRDNDHILDVVSRNLPQDAEPKYVAYATEAGTFQQHGFEVLILGPGSIEQAHQPDEWIEKVQLTQCETFLQRVVDDYCL
ncbi:acetylornithine deacetylase [Cardiobacteriaceae bacterium TAE3-ERU3]|nr:acetylornithine deacetylase [Cardiobacteriaceae bacterium TAE3-ERU3]